MKAIKSLVVAVALTAAGAVLATGAQAAGNPIARSGSWSGSHGGHWSGGQSGGHWNGGHWNGGHWNGGHWWGPRFGVYVGAPLFWSSWYWGYPYYYDWYYPRAVYVDRVIEQYPAATPDDAPAYEPAGPGAPAQAPAYMNYCASAKAYYPKVTSCPEGWKFLPSAPPR